MLAPGSPSSIPRDTQPSRRAVEVVLWPLTLIGRGHIFLLLYVVGGLVGIYFGIEALFERVVQYLVVVKSEYSITHEQLGAAASIAHKAVWGLAAPLVLSILALPVCSVWTTGKIQFGKLLQRTFPSALNCLQTFARISGAIFYLLVAPTAMIAVYYLFLQERAPESIRTIYLGSCLVLCMVGAFRVIPFLLSPLVAICAQVPANHAIEISLRALNGNRRVFALVVASAILVLCAFSKAVSFIPLSDPAVLEIFLRTGQILIGWYTISILGVLILDKVSEFEAGLIGPV